MTIIVSDKELECLEDCLIAVPLCREHKPLVLKPYEIDNMWQECKKCKRIRDRWWNSSWRIQGKLWEAYLKDTVKTQEGGGV